MASIRKLQETTTAGIGGYHPNGSKWPSGSIFENEGQKLYDLVRKHKPKKVVEVGAYYGCSTCWISQALIDNGSGKLISIDNSTYGDTWSMVPDKYFKVIEFVKDDALTCDVPKNIDMLFEDGLHAVGFTKAILERFKAPLVVCHDYCHRDVGKNVKTGFDSVFGEPTEIHLVEPSDCGLAIWRSEV